LNRGIHRPDDKWYLLLSPRLQLIGSAKHSRSYKHLLASEHNADNQRRQASTYRGRHPRCLAARHVPESPHLHLAHGLSHRQQANGPEQQLGQSQQRRPEGQKEQPELFQCPFQKAADFGDQDASQ